MPATTPDALPYPTGPEPFDVPGDLQALAVAAQTALAARAGYFEIPRNLLTAQQASLESAGTTGLAAVGNCTIARSTSQAWTGSASLAVTASGAGTATAGTTPTVPVTAGRLYTASVYMRAASVGRPTDLDIAWYTAGGAYISEVASSTTTSTTTGWARLLLASAAPAGAAFARVAARIQGSPVAGEIHYLDGLGIWEGAGGSWVDGGAALDPSTLGYYWDESVGRRRFEWDTNNNRWQMTWGDTGWRDIASLLGSGWTTAESVRIRRVNSTVHFAATRMARAGGSTMFSSLPAGWRAEPATIIPGIESTTTKAALMLGADIYCDFTASDARFAGSWSVTAAWPTSLPGSAIGSIPAP